MLPPSTPNLPKFRVSYEYPFEVTGLDYAGPFYVKNMYRKDIDVMNKCYVLLFTCGAATRAINLGTKPNQSSDSLLLALRRFTVRRGGVSKLFISDNFKSCRTKEVFGY